MMEETFTFETWPARAMFRPSGKSLAFQPRDVTFERTGEVVVVGRNCKDSIPTQSNLFFVCDAISFNHAFVWYDDRTEKFYIRDSQNSNGTYLNKHQEGMALPDGKLYQSKVTQNPRELYSGDLIQFGIQVDSDSLKKSCGGLSYNCVIAQLELFLPNGFRVSRIYYREKKKFGVMIPEKNAMDEAISLAPKLFELDLLLTELHEKEKNLKKKLVTVTKSVLLYKERYREMEKPTMDEQLIVTYFEALMREQEIVETDTSDAGEVRRKMSKLNANLLECQKIALNVIRKVTSDNLEEVAKTNELERKMDGLENGNSIMKLLSDKTAEKNKCLMKENVLLKKELLCEKDGSERLRHISSLVNVEEITDEEDEAEDEIEDNCFVSSIQEELPEDIVKISDVVIDEMVDEVHSYPEFVSEENMEASTSLPDDRSRDEFPSSSRPVSMDVINRNSREDNGNEVGGDGDCSSPLALPVVEDHRPETFDYPQWIDYSLIGPSCHLIMDTCKIYNGTCPVESIDDAIHRLTIINCVMSTIMELFEARGPQSDTLNVEKITEEVVEDTFKDAGNSECRKMSKSPRQFDVVNPVDYNPSIANSIQKENSFNDETKMWQTNNDYPETDCESTPEFHFNSEEAKAELEQILDESEPRSQPSEGCRQLEPERDENLLKLFSKKPSLRQIVRCEGNVLLQSFVILVMILVAIAIAAFINWPVNNNNDSP